MAGSDKTWVDNNPPQLDAADLNGITDEQNNLIVGGGQAVNTGDLQQQHKAVSVYSIVGDYYSDTGAANAYVITAPSPRIASPALVNEMTFRALIANTNTGASVLNYAGTGDKSVKLKGNKTLPAGALIAGQIVSFEYNSSDDIFIFNGPVSLDLKADILSYTFSTDADKILSAVENLYSHYSITGAVLTAARSITVSDAQRIFFATNDEAFPVTYKTSLGTGISVPPGESVFLMCDGVNVIRPDSQSASGAAKAWITFDGTAVTPVPADSYNVASITDNGVGDYTINFVNNMQTTNYLAVSGNNGSGVYIVQMRNDQKAVSSCPVKTFVSTTGTAQDAWPGVSIYES